MKIPNGYNLHSDRSCSSLLSFIISIPHGTKPSDWSLAPEDIQEQFLTLKAATR